MSRTKTSLAIDKEIWIEAKVAAVRRGISLAEFLEEAIQEKLKREVKNNGRSTD